MPGFVVDVDADGPPVGSEPQYEIDGRVLGLAVGEMAEEVRLGGVPGVSHVEGRTPAFTLAGHDDVRKRFAHYIASLLVHAREDRKHGSFPIREWSLHGDIMP